MPTEIAKFLIDRQLQDPSQQMIHLKPDGNGYEEEQYYYKVVQYLFSLQSPNLTGALKRSAATVIGVSSSPK